MAFDACMVHCIAHELNTALKGAKVERVLQPQSDEIWLQLHQNRTTYRLLLNAGANHPRIYLTNSQKENPLVAPMFCMLLRKHLNGAKILEIAQKDFERVIEITFESYDEMGFPCKKYLILEIMGKYSNLIFCNADFAIVSALKTVDFTTSRKRQVLPGMTYEMPPPQEKISFLSLTKEDFFQAVSDSQNKDGKAVLRNICAGLATSTVALLSQNATEPNELWRACADFSGALRNHTAKPYLLLKNGIAQDYFCLPAKTDGEEVCAEQPSFSHLLDSFFAALSFQEQNRQRSADLSQLVTTAKARLERKITAQSAELKESEQMHEYKTYADLITSQMYRLKIGMTEAILDCYDTDPPSQKAVPLQAKLTPAQNAQYYYKRYRKAKNAAAILQEQIEKAKKECDYLNTVAQSLLRAETEGDFDEIRAELAENGYGKAAEKAPKNAKNAKSALPKPMIFQTDGGFTVLCGKNNRQNDYITTKVAQKEDLWFHVKNHPASHVVLLCEGKDVPDNDLWQAAIIAATYSQAAQSQKVEVDYTRVRYVKKPGGAKPGFVIYLQNQTAYVTPNPALCARLRRP